MAQVLRGTAWARIALLIVVAFLEIAASGVVARERYGERSWADSEAELARAWADTPYASTLGWDSASPAVRDAWDRATGRRVVR